MLSNTPIVPFRAGMMTSAQLVQLARLQAKMGTCLPMEDGLL